MRKWIYAVLLAALIAGPALAGRPVRAQGDDLLPYQDPERSIEERIDDLLARMTLDEKIAQMTQVEVGSIVPTDLVTLGIGSVLSGGDGDPVQGNDAVYWAAMTSQLQMAAMQSRLGIPLIYGVDAVHGHNNVTGAVIFPHNIGLGAAGDPDLVERIGRATAEEMAATGIWWNFGPTVAVPQDIRWGRTYEGFSEDTALVSTLGAAMVRGLQGDDLADPFTVAATAKHFVGDGGTAWGSSTFLTARIDRGETVGDEAVLRAVHLPPYIAALEAGARVVMASFSSWNGLDMHAHHYLLTDVLKGELGFTGFVVSDWGGIDDVAATYNEAVAAAINAGIDMVMVPQQYPMFMQSLRKAVDEGTVSEARIDDAVRRILRVKFELGLFERPYPNTAWLDLVGSEEHRALGREAVARSLVLLKNENNTLPIGPDLPVVLVAGSAADDIGMQCGGWTVTWQGAPGAVTEGTTILEGIAEVLSAGSVLEYDAGGNFDDVLPGQQVMVGIAVVGEKPYAEWFGDTPVPQLSAADRQAIANLRERVNRLIVVVVSGRPLIMTREIEMADVVVAAWLPGTEGAGVADGLFGITAITGRLPYTWPREASQLPQTAIPEGEALFPFGYGLRTEAVDICCSARFKH